MKRAETRGQGGKKPGGRERADEPLAEVAELAPDELEDEGGLADG